MTFMVNTSPFAGKEGQFVTSRNIRDRLDKELLTNVSIRVESDTPDTFRVHRPRRTATRDPDRNDAARRF